MDIFNNDPFDDIFREFFGNARVRRARVRDKDEEQNTQFIEDEDYVYCMIELPGYQEKDIRIVVRDGMLIVSARSEQHKGVQDYLAQKQQQGITVQEALPPTVKTKNFSKTFNNGVLEVTFEKR